MKESPKVNSLQKQSGMTFPEWFRHVNQRRGREFPERPDHLTVLSLGAGVQSTTLALMAARGEIEAPDVAIFADTQWEPAGVYRHLEWLDQVLFGAGIPLTAATVGSLRTDLVRSRTDGVHIPQPPLYTARTVPAQKPVSITNQQALMEVEWSTDPSPVKVRVVGTLKRGCTRDYKIRCIQSVERQLLGRKRMPSDPIVSQWIGLSTDEMQRMKMNPKPWAENRWPLIEMEMSRASCERWLLEHGYPIPQKSACIGCPYHDNRYWQRLREHDPESWADAVEVDRIIRNGLKGTTAELYLHRSCRPLDEAISDDHQIDLFQEECDGVCGI